MHVLLEYIPLIAFFAVYKLVDIFWATGVLIGLSALQLGYGYFKDGKIATRHLVMFSIALVLGSLTILFHDEQFIKWKATFIYAGLGGTLLISRYFFKKNLVEKMLTSILANAMENQQKLEVPRQVWDKINAFWMVLLFCVAALNIYIAYQYSLDFWVNFKVFGLTAITFVAFIITMIMLYKYFPEEEAS
ncbi:inner membrane-spanning protein YciB [Pseudoalteromonas tunicata]|uniref:inner membrane-spanning protein YciB n=1 Tax=Pseudoalteromonas tunicata TaxID=314281 RepID=UPI00273E07AA|nr:inner membrane-spanning protein YciB [Pseudoalteromonas tunicata]MDP4982076.1 septation protein IspZ [Pseudoalteromonas tunicata]MDP5211509.1 septation protein IspZ [Pseudoalteromonas tunicata]